MAGGIRLGAEEAWDFIAASHTAILVSLRRGGAPIALPVWSVVLDRRIYVTGPVGSRKFARIARDPRVAFLVESGRHWSELAAVHLNGAARTVEDAELLVRVGEAFDAKYSGYRTARADMPASTRSHYETPYTTIEILPEDRVLSWDNSRLFP